MMPSDNTEDRWRRKERFTGFLPNKDEAFLTQQTSIKLELRTSMLDPFIAPCNATKCRMNAESEC